MDKITVNDKKLAIVKFAKLKYDEIHTCIVKDTAPALPPKNDLKPALLRRQSTRDLALNELVGNGYITVTFVMLLVLQKFILL